jgi:hypothetical protein
VCCRYTTTPQCRSGVCVSIAPVSCFCSSFPVVALRVELSTTRLSAVSGQTGPRLPRANVVVASVGMAGLEPASPCSQSTWVRRYPTSRQSERADLNRRSPDPPPASQVPGRDNQASLPSVLQWPVRESNPSSRLEGPESLTDRRTGHCRRAPSTQKTTGLARRFHAVGREVLESSSAAFQAAATPSQLPTQTKKPDVVVTPGFWYSSRIGTARRHVRNG